MRLITILTLLCSAPSLFASTRVVQTAATPAEAVNWTAGVSYTYDGSGNVRQIGNDRFVYDQTGRLVQAQINGVTRVYTYDAFGNRTGCTSQPGTPSAADCQLGLSIDPSSNRVIGVAYDKVGNVETYYGHTYTYDDVNMPVRDDRGAQAREFVYTAGDERIAVHDVGSGWSWTIRDVTGKVLREFSSTEQGAFTWARDYVYRDGLLMASLQHSATSLLTYHYHLDHLGTPRRVTDQNNRIAGFHDYHAFGPEVSGGLTERTPAPLQYTGHERDKWDGNEGPDTLDYMHARYYSPVLGRFLSLDRAPANPKSPQTWNMYAYAKNSPLRILDPDGLWGRDIIVVPVTIVMSTRDKGLQHRVQRSLSRAQHFFAQADVHLSVTRFEGSVTYDQEFMWGPSRLDGTVNGANGPQNIGDFVRHTRGIVVVVGDTGKFTSFSGETAGIGGPTLLGTQTEESTVSDEFAHALGNIPPFVEAISKAEPAVGLFYLNFGNWIADRSTDVQEGRTALGLGLQGAYQDMLRDAATRIICDPLNRAGYTPCK